MLSLDDPRWQQFTGGYRAPYDASPALPALFSGSVRAELWDELFEELHHQGDLGPASYAAVPHIVHHIEHSPRLPAGSRFASWRPSSWHAPHTPARTLRYRQSLRTTIMLLFVGFRTSSPHAPSTRGAPRFYHTSSRASHSHGDNENSRGFTMSST